MVLLKALPVLLLLGAAVILGSSPSIPTPSPSSKALSQSPIGQAAYANIEQANDILYTTQVKRIIESAPTTEVALARVEGLLDPMERAGINRSADLSEINDRISDYERMLSRTESRNPWNKTLINDYNNYLNQLRSFRALIMEGKASYRDAPTL